MEHLGRPGSQVINITLRFGHSSLFLAWEPRLNSRSLFFSHSRKWSKLHQLQVLQDKMSSLGLPLQVAIVLPIISQLCVYHRTQEGRNSECFPSPWDPEKTGKKWKKRNTKTSWFLARCWLWPSLVCTPIPNKPHELSHKLYWMPTDRWDQNLTAERDASNFSQHLPSSHCSAWRSVTIAYSRSSFKKKLFSDLHFKQPR